VAGGKGLRMNSEIPKQFMKLKGIPVLMHTLDAFFNTDHLIEIILVLPKHQVHFWQRLIKEYSYKTPHRIALGGETRFQSVKNGLSLIHGPGLVAVHDGVRPLVTEKVIATSYQLAMDKKAAVTVVPSKDSIRVIKEDGLSMAVDRNKYMQVQTPQTFDVDALKNAYQLEEKITYTDDASVFEANKGIVYLLEGDYSNIKITTPEDIVVAEVLMS